MMNDLSLEEKLQFLQREVKDKKFKLSFTILMYNDNELLWQTVTDDYFKAMLSDFLEGTCWVGPINRTEIVRLANKMENGK